MTDTAISRRDFLGGAIAFVGAAAFSSCRKHQVRPKKEFSVSGVGKILTIGTDSHFRSDLYLDILDQTGSQYRLNLKNERDSSRDVRSLREIELNAAAQLTEPRFFHRESKIAKDKKDQSRFYINDLILPNQMTINYSNGYVEKQAPELKTIIAEFDENTVLTFSTAKDQVLDIAVESYFERGDFTPMHQYLSSEFSEAWSNEDWTNSSFGRAQATLIAK